MTNVDEHSSAYPEAAHKSTCHRTDLFTLWKLHRTIKGTTLTTTEEVLTVDRAAVKIICHQPPIATIPVPGHNLPPNYRATMRALFFFLLNNLNNGCGRENLLVDMELL
jgi:hypothetical protein